jgi:signal peptidase II
MSLCRHGAGTGEVTDMKLLQFIVQTPNRRIATLALLVVALDQFTKELVIRLLPNIRMDEKVIVDGFLKLVHWENTGAAWSMFTGNNWVLAIVAIVALVVLAFSRHHFNARSPLGQVAFGLIFGGIVGNLIDRVRVHHVTDFIYFYLQQRGGAEIGFPAFNIADSAICTGVGLIFLITWRGEHRPRSTEPAAET